MKKHYLFLLILLPLCGWAQSFRTVNLTGNFSDFNLEETYDASDNNTIRYGVAYDQDYLYFGVYNTAGTFGGQDALTIFIDTDPNGSNGTATGNDFNGVTPSLPFNADVAIRVEQNYNERRLYDNAGSSWFNGANYTQNFNANVGNSHRSFRILKSDIGNPEFIRFTMWMGFNGGHFAEVPGDLGSSNNPVVTQYFGTTAINRAGANPSKVVNTNGLYLTNASGTIPAGTYTLLEISNNATLAGDVTIAAGGSLITKGIIYSVNVDTHNLIFNDWAGVQTESDFEIGFNGTGAISFQNGGISNKNNELNGRKAQFNVNTTFNNTFWPYQLRCDAVTRLNSNARFIGSNIFYGTSGTLHLATNNPNINNVWSSSFIPSALGVPRNVVIDQDYNLDSDKFVLGYLKIDSGNLDLNGFNLNFNSNSLATAVLGPVANGSNILGNTMYSERFIPKRSDDARAFRFLSSPVNGNSIYQSLQNNGASQLLFDTQVTGGTAANGFDQSATNNASMFKFLNQSVQWSAVTNTQNEMFNAGMPYRVFVRGDRTVDLMANGPAVSTTLRATGSPVVGTVTYDSSSTVNALNSGASAFNFVGNPYQAQVDMRQVLNASTGVNPNAVYVWDPTLNTRGAYVTVIIDADDSINGTPSNPSSDADQFLQPWQSVFLVNSNMASSASVVFQEEFKVLSTSNTAVFSTPAASNRLSVELLSGNGNTIDAAQAFYASTENAGIDDRDLTKIGNIDEDLSWNMQGNQIAILRHSIPVNGEQFPLQLTSYRAQNYSLRLNYTTPVVGMNLVLVDTYLQTETLVSGQAVYPFSIDPSIAASAAAGRFYVKFENTTLSAGDSAFAKAITLYPNPVTNGIVQVNNLSGKPFHATIYNMLGQEMLSINNNNDASIDVNNLKPGHYLVRIEQKNSSKVEKLIVQ